MTTISRSVAAVADATPPRSAAENRAEAVVVFRPAKLTAEQKAEFAQRKTAEAELAAASEKRLLEAKKRTSVEGMESHQMYLPNISDLSLESAKKSLSMAQTMINNKEDAGITVNGRYGDKDISDLNTYKAALTDYISKFETSVSKAGVGVSTAPSQASTAAASLYRQLQGMAGNDRNS